MLLSFVVLLIVDVIGQIVSVSRLSKKDAKTSKKNLEIEDLRLIPFHIPCTNTYYYY